MQNLYFIIIIFIILLDQISKNIITAKVEYNKKIELIKNKFYITNVHNKGAAYGILKNKPKFLLFFNSSLIIIIFIFFVKLLKGNYNNILKLATSFIIGGALGNIIDRIKKGYVRDFIFIKFKNAPIFNFADLFLFASPLILLVSLFKESK